MKNVNNNSRVSLFIKILLVICVFSLLFVGYFHQITAMTQDLGRHFLIGKIVLETGHVPLTNLFSYTYPDFPFINMHWLSEVVFYLIFQMSGFDGLLLFSTVTMLLAFSLIFFYAFKRTSIFSLAITSLLYLRILFERTDIRPEVFSYIFIAIFIFILYRYREKFSWWIFLLIPLEILWVNMHIYFIIGIGVLGLFCIDEIIRHRDNLITKRSGLLFLITFLAILATFVNPSGFQGAIYPLHIFENYGYTIEENQSIFFLESLGFHKSSILYFKITTVLLFITLCLSYKKTRLIDWLLAISFTIIGASAVRNLPLFVFATFVPFALFLPLLLQKLTYLLPPIPYRKAFFSQYTLIGLLFLLFCWQIQEVQATRTFGFGVQAGAEQGVDFLQTHQIKGPIFNNFDIGSYLDYRLYPTERVFIDGRPGEYPASFFQKVYIPMQQDPALFARVSRQYNFNTIIFSHTDQTPWGEQFMNAIVRDKNWKTIYLDPTIIVLVKNSQQNAMLIKKFGLPETLPMTLPNDERLLRQAAHFYNATSLPDQLLPILKRLVEIKPHDCQILGALTTQYLAQNDPVARIYQAKYQNSCPR